MGNQALQMMCRWMVIVVHTIHGTSFAMYLLARTSRPTILVRPKANIRENHHDRNIIGYDGPGHL
jgi:hypothetical protein